MKAERKDGLATRAGSAWKLVTQQAPQRDVTVETKIEDGRGVRNQTTLKLHGNLWFIPDMSMYVYYSPTHWRHLPNAKLIDAWEIGVEQY